MNFKKGTSYESLNCIQSAIFLISPRTGNRESLQRSIKIKIAEIRLHLGSEDRFRILQRTAEDLPLDKLSKKLQ